MPLLTRTRVRREMTALARVRRRIQQLGPYQSLGRLVVVAGKGYWLSSTAMIIGPMRSVY